MPQIFFMVYNGYELVVTDDHFNDQKGVDWRFMKGNKFSLKTFRGRKFRQRRAKSVRRKMALPCILNKTAALSSKSIWYFKLYPTELLKPLRQDTKWYAPYIMGSSVYIWAVCYTVTACSPCTHLNALFSK